MSSKSSENGGKKFDISFEIYKTKFNEFIKIIESHLRD